MIEWLSTWEPEHIVGLATAISAAVGAWWLHGKSKGASTGSKQDKEMMSSVRLHPLDLLMLESAVNELHEIRRDIKGVMENLNHLGKDTAILLDRNKT